MQWPSVLKVKALHLASALDAHISTMNRVSIKGVLPSKVLDSFVNGQSSGRTVYDAIVQRGLLSTATGSCPVSIELFQYHYCK